MADPWDGRDFVFIGGMHRSGTSTLSTMLGGADGVSNLTGTGFPEDEGQYLQDVFPRGTALGGMTRWALDDRAYLDEVDAASVPDAASRLWSGWSPHWDLSATTLIEKTPLNLTRTRFLQSVFPRSAFVVITRHPVSQALAVSTKSAHRGERYGFGLPRLVEQWVRAHEAFRADAPHLRRLHVVRYEHLVADPAGVLDDLRDFLGSPLRGATVDVWDPARSRAYADRWAAGRRLGWAASVRAAVSSLGPHGPGPRVAVRRLTDRALFDRHRRQLATEFGARISALGYDLDDLDRAQPWGDRSPAG